MQHGSQHKRHEPTHPHHHDGPAGLAQHDHPHEAHGHQAGLLGRLQDLIRPHSHDAPDKVDSALETSAEGMRALKLSFIALMVTALLQAGVVAISGSIALLADTIHNFADALTSVPLWIAFALGRRAANRRYTYGFGRAEDLAGVAIVLVIFGSALLAAWESIQRLLQPVAPSNLGLVAAAAGIGFLGNEAAALYRIRIGRKIGSAALVADGYHARADGLTSLAVLLGVGGVVAGFPLADPLVGLLISFAILLITRDAAMAMWHRLMDAVEPELIDSIERVAAAVDGVQAVRAIRARWHGHRIQAELQVVVDEDLPTWRSHQIVEAVRRELFHQVPRLAAISAHADPCGHGGVDHHDSTAHHDQPPVMGSAPPV